MGVIVNALFYSWIVKFIAFGMYNIYIQLH